MSQRTATPRSKMGVMSLATGHRFWNGPVHGLSQAVSQETLACQVTPLPLLLWLMSALLEEPAVRRALYRVSVDFYHRLGELGLLGKNVELLDGLIVEKMPKSPLHSSIARRCHGLLASALKSGQLVLREDPIVTADSAPEPDLAVVQGKASDYWQKHPATADLVIEIAVSSAEIDRRKTSIYAAAGVKEYWLVEPEARRLTVFRRPAVDHYCETRLFEETGEVTSESVPAFKVRLPDFWQVGAE